MAFQKTLTRDFVLSFFAQLCFSSVFCILIPTIPIYLAKFQAKESEIGILVGIFSVSSLILRPIVGRALLIIPERLFMVCGALIYIASSFAYIIAPPFWPLLGLRIFHGVGLALFSTASFTFIANITPQAQRGQSLSYFSLSMNLSWALGPFLGILLINNFGFRVMFLVCAGLSLASLWMAMKLSKRTISTENQSPMSDSYLSRAALPFSFVAFILSVIWGTLAAFFPLYALMHGVSNSGIFFVFLAGTTFLGRAFFAEMADKYGRKQIIMPCLAIVIISITIIPLSKTLAMFVLSAVLLGMGWALLFPSLLACAVDNAGSAQGPAMGTFTALVDLGGGLGPMIMGIILEYTNYSVMFFGLVLTAVINLIFFYFIIWKRADWGEKGAPIREVSRAGIQIFHQK
jgi:MFS family permease